MIGLIINLFQGFIAFLIGTIVFDLLHYFFHVCLRSKNKYLKTIGKLHLIHHQFYSVTSIHKEWIKKNLYHHVIFEYVIHCLGIMLCLFYFNTMSILFALSLETIIFTVECYFKGTVRHKPYEQLPADKGSF